ncbi:MAG: ABC transporter permease [Anaerolineales bacterium]|jgi:putative spermidine/putrescine transport system permease protein|uniref:ABC transporter permease n=1 Tax=Candidatus Villigracilis vicinus TaxID=3140679 RepID=UPI003135CD98|nr:ABC transporter permease [Anaerolineales bacterium]MBK7451720.1 ABC transporter permease [Anaerolineales bacterium]MBK9781597.1 ABC transporter permease [Anaerolineales bacterium]
MLKRISTYFYLRPKAVLALFLTPPLLWFLVVYIGALLTLLVNSFFYLDGFTGQVVREFTLATYAKLLLPTNLQIFFRTTIMAILVTVASVIIAFPISYYMARFASPRLKTILYLAVTLPLWISYVVRVYSWKLILAQEGIISWFARIIHLDGLLDWYLSNEVVGGPSLAVSATGIFLVFLYIWLPYMIIPIQTALERVPKSLIEASSDLGASPAQTFRTVLLPLSFPGVVAGSIFTFSLTLGDFIVPQLFGTSSFYIGKAVLTYQGTSGNIPLAAAFTMGPIVIMIIYLLIARKLGAFDAL